MRSGRFGTYKIDGSVNKYLHLKSTFYQFYFNFMPFTGSFDDFLLKRLANAKSKG